MTNDPLNRYQSMMQDTKVPDHLPEKVLEQVRAQAEQHNPTSSTSTSSTANQEPHKSADQDAAALSSSHSHTTAPRTFTSKRSRTKRYAIAACLAALAVAVGLSLALPGLDKKVTSPFDFSIQAYGAASDTILSMGTNDTIIFDVDSLLTAPAGQHYEQLGIYPGCLMRIEGSDIVRIQANIDRGELCRYTYEEFVKSSDPDRWTEVLNWKQTKIGEGDRFASYDFVHPTLGDDGRDRNDPDKLVGIKYYQRLGSTIDVPVTNETGSQLSDYCFGLWTNEGTASLEGAIEVFDGAKLTITVEKSDGSCATKVIELTAADVKANIIPAENGGNPTRQLVPEIIDLSAKTEEDLQNDAANNITTVHTLYGTIIEQNGETFPCGAESYPTLDKPLTEPLVLEPAANNPPTFDPSARPGPDLDKNAIANLGESYTFESNSLNANREPVQAYIESVITNVERSRTLPEGMTTADIPFLYPEGQTSDEWFEREGFGIAADGTLTPGYSYALVTKKVTNTSDQSIDASVASGAFVTLNEEKDDSFTTIHQGFSEVMWRSKHEGPLWDSHLYFEMLDPGETFEFQMLFPVPDSALDSPDLAFVSENGSMQGFKQAYRVGTVS